MSDNTISGVIPMGYLIEGNTFYSYEKKSLISIGGSRKEIRLRSTQSNVLEYLLEHAIESFVTDEELMLNVWEKNDLRASTQRVWQVINSLRLKIHELGISDDFILRVSKKGFYIRESSIRTIYCSPAQKHQHVEM